MHEEPHRREQAEASRRAGAVLAWRVFDEYERDGGKVRAVVPRLRNGTILPGSPMPHSRLVWPLLERRLPERLAAVLSSTNKEEIQAALLAFVRRFGLLGREKLPRPDVRPFIPFTEPIDWMLAHARGVRMVLKISAWLRDKRGLAPGARLPGTFRGAIAEFEGTIPSRDDKGWTIGIGRKVESYYWHGYKADPEARARRIRREIINGNLVTIPRQLGDDDRMVFTISTPLEAVYWQLANAVESGTVKRCEAFGCDGIFMQQDPRQRFCPPLQGNKESACAARERQRQKRGGPKARVKVRHR